MERPWEQRPRAGWDEFVAARERLRARLAEQGLVARLERAWAAPACARAGRSTGPEDEGPPHDRSA